MVRAVLRASWKVSTAKTQGVHGVHYSLKMYKIMDVYVHAFSREEV